MERFSVLPTSILRQNNLILLLGLITCFAWGVC